MSVVHRGNVIVIGLSPVLAFLHFFAFGPLSPFLHLPLLPLLERDPFDEEQPDRLVL